MEELEKFLREQWSKIQNYFNPTYPSKNGNTYKTPELAKKYDAEYDSLKNIGYIGGTPTQARNKYFKADKRMTQYIDSVADSHGLPYYVLRASLGNEGFIDDAILRINKTYQQRKDSVPNIYNVLGDNALNTTHGINSSFNLFGSDDSGTYYEKRPDVKAIIDKSKIDFHTTKNRNEKGRIVNTLQGTSIKDDIVIHSAVLSSFRNQIKREHPDWNDDQVNRYTLYRFNYGPNAKGSLQEVMNRKKFNPNIYK